jgi:O-Antigen ligase
MTKPFLLKHSYLFLAGLYLLAVGLPLSKFLTGFSQVVLVASIFLEGNFTEKLQRLKHNKIVWIISGIWFMHLAGLLYSENIQSGLWDARMKMPILILTIAAGAAVPLSRETVFRILWTFTAAVFVGTLVSTAVLAGILARPVDDIRDIFIFNISHIRFALFTCLSVFFLAHQATSKTTMSWARRFACVILMAWLVAFLFLAESVTGLAILFTLALPALVVLALTRKSKLARITVLGAVLLFPAAIALKSLAFLKELNTPHEVAINTADRTALGHVYYFNPDDRVTENGYRIWIYVNFEEMREAWNKRSAMPYDSLDRKSQLLSQTLVRYLTSLGYRKDGEAVSKLTAGDIHNIESGIANCHYAGTSNFKARLMELNWEYQQAVNNRSASGHSATMRIEFWKAGMQIMKKHFWTGVGTGDLQQEFNRQYEESKSSLGLQWRLRAHNQYLSILLAFGIFGLLYFLFALFYPLFKLKRYGDFLYGMFFCIVMFSMLTEDTLETPAGSAFFALFNSLFLFSLPEKREDA